VALLQERQWLLCGVRDDVLEKGKVSRRYFVCGGRRDVEGHVTTSLTSGMSIMNVMNLRGLAYDIDRD
jgi:hypothetical protein